MFSFKRLQCVFRMSVVTLVALGTYSLIQAQTQHYNTTAVPQNQEQIQAQSQQHSSNQKSSGGNVISRLFGSSDPPKNTNQQAAPANTQPRPQPQQQQPQQYTPVQPPRPTTGGPATVARTQPVYQPVTSASATQQQYGYGTTQPVTSRSTLSQSVAGSSAGGQSAMPSGTLERMQAMQGRMPDISSQKDGTLRSGASGLPTPPPVPGGEPEQTQNANTQRSGVTTDRKSITIGDDTKIANRSISTDTSPARNTTSSGLTRPPVVPKDDNTNEPENKGASGLRPTPQERTPQPTPLNQAPRPAPVTSKPEGPRPVPQNESGLMKQQSPVLSVVTEGPKAMIVGKEETYTFVVTNNSMVPAEAVVLNIELPRWLKSTQAPELTTGSTSLLEKNDDYGIFQWQISRIGPDKSETLKLHLVSGERRPFELKCSLDIKQNTSQTKIDVQQPVIKMEFEGPNEVLWGEEKNYRLKIRNIGTGDATDMVLQLTTSGVVKAEAPIKLLPVGEEKVLDVIVEAKDDIGELQIKVLATDPYGMSEETAKRVIVKRAALELDIDAPGMQFVDNMIDYVLIARNVGTTASLNTVVEATLPLGVKFVSCTHDGEFDPDTNRVFWDAGTLPIDNEFVCTVICEAKREGEFRLDAKVTEKTGLAQMVNALTNVEAIADIILEIEKPQDPIEVGTTTEYVVIITNRGSKAAEGIDVGVYFPDAIEPISVEGGRARIDMERNDVVFERIPFLAAREKLTYKVRGRGLDSGSHRIKAILVCQSTETELDYQVMSRFYQGRSNRASNALAGDSQPLRGNSTSVTPGSSLRDNRNGNPSATVQSVPTMTRPGQESLAKAPTAVNPLSTAGTPTNPGLPSSQMQGASVGNGTPVPNMQIPDMNFNQQPITAPTPGASPGRLQQRTTGAMPLTPPPVVGTPN